MIRVGNRIFLFQFIESVERIAANNFTIYLVSGAVVNNLTRDQIQPFLDYMNLGI